MPSIDSFFRVNIALSNSSGSLNRTIFLAFLLTNA
jgi:hypothetical protein